VKLELKIEMAPRKEKKELKIEDNVIMQFKCGKIVKGTVSTFVSASWCVDLV
jgi:hypothetical protein